MSNTALITGASSGIGKAFAEIHAGKGGDVILCARREDALKELKAKLEKEFDIKAHVFSHDLGTAEGAQALYDDVKAAGLTVDILINNAGFGGHGLHTERPLEDELAMIDLNIKALVTLTHRVGADMVARGSGRILNVGSTAGFMPGPQQAVYFATKAFVNSFSQAIDQELRPKGVTCTVLAPGYVETEFAARSNLEGTQLVKGGGATARQAAKNGYDAMRAGQLVTVNDAKVGFFIDWLVPILPRRMVLKMVEKMQTKKDA
jgi:hypothetical protein